MKRVYKPGIPKLIGNFILQAIGAFFISAVAGYFLCKIIDVDLDRETLLNMLDILTVLAVIFSAVKSFGFDYKKIIVEDGAVYFTRFGKPFITLNSQDFYFSSYVVQHTYNGIPSGKDRFLLATTRDGRQTRYKCHYISNNSFNEMMAVLGSLNRTDLSSDPLSMQTSFAEPAYRGNARFTLPKQANLKAISKRTRNIMIGFAAVFVIMAGVYVWLGMIASANSASNEAMLIGAAVFFGMFLIFLLPFTVVHLTQHSKIKKSMPEEVELTPDAIIMDGHHHYFADILQIKASPPNYSNTIYSNNNRYLTIREDKKPPKIYMMGTINAPKKGDNTVFVEYPMLCEELTKAYHADPVKFQYDL